jgi:hypothetical protein
MMRLTFSPALLPPLSDRVTLPDTVAPDDGAVMSPTAAAAGSAVATTTVSAAAPMPTARVNALRTVRASFVE